MWVSSRSLAREAAFVGVRQPAAVHRDHRGAARQPIALPVEARAADAGLGEREAALEGRVTRRVEGELERQQLGRVVDVVVEHGVELPSPTGIKCHFGAIA